MIEMQTKSVTKPRSSNAHVLRIGDVLPGNTELPYIRKTARLNRGDTGLEWNDIQILATEVFTLSTQPRGYCAWPSVRDLNMIGICLFEEQGSTVAIASVKQATVSIDEELDRIFALAEHEDFETGMCSEFDAQLRAFAGRYYERAISALHDRLQRTTNTELCVQAIGSLGRMRLAVTRDARLASLATFLKSSDFEVRNAAMRALLKMQDKRALPLLRQARDAERNGRLKKSFEEVIALLAA